MPAEYVIMTDLVARLPQKFITQALDDDQDGASDAEVFAAIQKAVRQDIDARLGQRYDPNDYGANPPALVKKAATVFAIELLYMRRGISEENNPQTKEANSLRSKLDRIGKGEEPLTPERKPVNLPGGAITKAAKTVSKRGAK